MPDNEKKLGIELTEYPAILPWDYLRAMCPVEAVDNVLRRAGSEGWELVQMLPSMLQVNTGAGGSIVQVNANGQQNIQSVPGMMMIFKRPAIEDARIAPSLGEGGTPGGEAKRVVESGENRN